ncbi:MAG: FecR domain-containing protein [Nitrospirota bacterium]
MIIQAMKQLMVPLTTAYLISFLLLPPHISAARPMAFGEINATGNVQMESSSKKWMPLQGIYPLLKNTKLKTGEGVVFISTKDNSRIDLSRDTEADISAEEETFRVSLRQGTIAFNIDPSASLTVTTKHATVSVEQQIANYLVAGTGVAGVKNVQGMVLLTDRGTLIRSVSGKVRVVANGLQAKVLNTGENLFVSEENEKIPVAADPADPVWTTGHIQGLIIGTFFTSVTISALETFRSKGGIKSPSGF